MFHIFVAFILWFVLYLDWFIQNRESFLRVESGTFACKTVKKRGREGGREGQRERAEVNSRFSCRDQKTSSTGMTLCLTFCSTPHTG